MEESNEQRTKLSRFGKIGASIRKQDKFSEGFQMKLADGENSVPTWMGTLCSIILLIVIILYTVQKIEVLLTKKDVDVLTAINDTHLDSEFHFGYGQGFNFATKWQNLYDETEIN